MPSRRALLATALSCAALPARAARRSADPGLTFPEPGRRSWADAIGTLRIGISGGENEADRLARNEPYQALLEETFRLPVRLYPAPDFAGVGQAFAAGHIEMAQMGAANFAGTWIDTKGAIEPLVAAEADDGTLGYVAVMVARADSGIADIAGMRGKSLAWADPASTSGYFAPRAALRAAGIDPTTYFSRTGFAGGHEQAVVAVLHRQYDAGCTWASGAGDFATGYSRGALKVMVDKGMLDMRDLRVIWRSDPIPAGPIACRTNLPDAFKEDMRAFFLAMPKTHPKVYEGIERGGGTGFRTVTMDDYALVLKLREEEAAERRRRR
ncbi:phosphate/phosphite/phosphonate ABC transporter substrate-binding protein [Pararoseomonas indoligenes]|uniref:Phosphate/phosphite/phosphonate ABC transporter substrate-binding protein n=1 Tax=Roseomonas indoligenes TaxID=2820811 RepID=A0A940MZH6_9PROT|nr:phosphate/phosphite/phosphonate ABC transporter substrate-binding protein [Pararoseomonas indoligenes]MBP0496219.1 phosphate/phosphite/phosphonate ABC transporter substrate-binding protein [Pararoseomonas indoligenes]